jgi:hypothetical protein
MLPGLRTLVGSVVVVVALATARTASADLINFDTPGDLDGNFNRVGAATMFVETDAIGVGGTRALDVVGADSGPDASASYNKRTFDMTVLGARAVVSVLYKPENSGATLAQRVLDVGLVNTFFTGAGAQAGVSLDRDATNTPLSLILRTRVDNASPGTPVSPSFAVDPARFYRVTADLTNIGNGQIQLEASVVDYGPNGLTPGATIQTLSAPLTTNISADADALASFRSRGGPAIAALDNFFADIIPEPTALAVLGAVTVPCLLRRRPAGLRGRRA